MAKSTCFSFRYYTITQTFPKHELFSLTSQLRRAAISVPSNIVEGFGRWTDKEKIRFYNIAQASLKETHYQLRLAHDLQYTDTITARNNANEVNRLISGLIKGLISHEPNTSS
ncbi:MAG: four helix bundle protein [Rubritalea sp.]|uniref:four helix bundle protein n=1 Tax=Rubritalea sp. TaxID=2109375 RepID=UPI00324220C9